MKNWEHKEEWTKAGENCLVKVLRHEQPIIDGFGGRGGNIWCVYAYIYPEHPLFSRLSSTEPSGLPLHKGETFFKIHHGEDGVVTSVQIGADYNHLGDERFTHMHLKDDAIEVFADAITLLERLKLQ